MKTFIVSLLICFIILSGCKTSQSDIVVLGDKAEKSQKFVHNGGKTTQVIYYDSKGKARKSFSNKISVPVDEKCEKVSDLDEVDPIPEPPEIQDEPVEEIEEKVFTTEIKTYPNHVVAAGYEVPEVSFQTSVYIPRKPPKIKLQKTSDEDKLCCDRQLTFRIKFTNIGGDDAYNIDISDLIPPEVEYVEESAGSEPYVAKIEIERGEEKKAKKIMWNIEGPIPAGQSGEVFFTVVCPQARPKLSCFVRFNPKALNVGQEGEVICTVANTGTGPAENVNIGVVIPKFLEYEGQSIGREVKFKMGTIEPGKSVVKRLKIKMRSGGKLDNIVANVTSSNAEGCGCIVPPTPTLTIQKTGQSEVVGSAPIEYTIVVRNTSTRKAPATNCILTDKLPPFCNVKNISHGGKYDSKKHLVTWKLGTLMPGAIESRTLVVIPQRAATLVDKAQVECDEGLIVTDTATTIVRGIPALHIQCYDTEDPVEVGGTTTYIIEVLNEGFKEATGLKIVNTIPRTTKFISGQCKDPSGIKIGFKLSEDGTKILFDPVPILKSGEKAVYRITVKVQERVQLKNVTEIKYNEFFKTLIVEEPTMSY